MTTHSSIVRMDARKGVIRMGNNDVLQSLVASINSGLVGLVFFLQSFIAGLIVLILGLVVASLLKQLALEAFKLIRVENWLHKYGVPEAKGELNWSNILAEIIRWFVIVLFLIPAVKVWGIPEATNVINQVVLYIPQVFIATLMALIGLVFANLAHDVVRASVSGLSRSSANVVANIAKYAIIVFVGFGVLVQLGVAADLIRILFTGIVAMIAIAGGLAFGFGGQDMARDLLEEVRKKLKG